MFNITWGEIIIVTSVGIYFVGKKDLPKISRIVGVNIGRIVGMIHGLRATATNAVGANNSNKKELQQLQYQLQTNIRQIQLLKNEITSSFNPTINNNNMSNTTTNNIMSNSNSSTPMMIPSSTTTLQQQTISSGINSDNDTTSTAVIPVIPPLHSYYNINNNNNSSSSSIPTFPIPSTTNSTQSTLSTNSTSSSFLNNTANTTIPYLSSLSSNSNLTIHNKQSLRAIAEDEWQRHGIGFASRAEGLQVQGQYQQTQQNHSQSVQTTQLQGSYLVADIIKQSLINDEQDRILNEQYNLLYK